MAAISPKSFLEGGSALPDEDRRRLAAELPPSQVIEIEGGHCLHRDAPDAWLAAVDRITAASSRVPAFWPDAGTIEVAQLPARR